MNVEKFISDFELCANSIKKYQSRKPLFIFDDEIENVNQIVEWNQDRKLQYFLVSSKENQKRILNAQKIFEEYKIVLNKYYSVHLDCFNW